MTKNVQIGSKWVPDPPYEYYGPPLSAVRRSIADAMLRYTRPREAQYEACFPGDTRIRHGLDMVEAWLANRDIRMNDLVTATRDVAQAGYWASVTEDPSPARTDTEPKPDVFGTPLMEDVIEDAAQILIHERSCALLDASEVASHALIALHIIFGEAGTVIDSYTEYEVAAALAALKDAPHA